MHYIKYALRVLARLIWDLDAVRWTFNIFSICHL